MSASSQIRAVICELYQPEMIPTIIDASDLNNTGTWHTSPVSAKLGIPLIIKQTDTANHATHKEKTLGARMDNKVSQLLFLDTDISSRSFGTYTKPPLCEDIIVARADGQDLDVRDLRDLVSHLQKCVDSAMESFLDVIKTAQRYEDVEKGVERLFSRDWARGWWELMKRGRMGVENVGDKKWRRNPFG